MPDRSPVVAGSFYPGTKAQLEKELKRLIPQVPAEDKVIAKGIISPHAGYIYSGGVAGTVFAAVNIPEVAVILAPNHTGIGKPFALWPEGTWSTPIGTTEIDKELTGLIRNDSNLAKDDTSAHTQEHSAEVQLPFLQYLRPDIKIVVMVISASNLESLKSLGESLKKSLDSYPKSVLIVASSDMNHYESQKTTETKDQKAIDRILEFDTDGLYETVRKHNITMCGYAPTIVMLEASKALGAQKVKLIKYQTSGDTSGDYSQVVGYAGIVVT